MYALSLLFRDQRRSDTNGDRYAVVPCSSPDEHARYRLQLVCYCESSGKSRVLVVSASLYLLHIISADRQLWPGEEIREGPGGRSDYGLDNSAGLVSLGRGR